MSQFTPAARPPLHLRPESPLLEIPRPPTPYMPRFPDTAGAAAAVTLIDQVLLKNEDVKSVPADSLAGRSDQLTNPEGRIRWGVARAIGRAALQEARPVAFEERCLADVDNLLCHRRPDGTYPQDVLQDVHVNAMTRVKEPAMPFAVSTTFQPYVDGKFCWQRQTALQVAASGYRYHEHEEALQRADVEVVEAIFAEEHLGPGRTSVMLSPRMSRKDASKEVAEHEHLADDDSVRIQWIDYHKDGTIRGKYVQSILIRSDLRQAFVTMLADPNNIFGKAITVEDPDSALSVMKAFTDMQIDSSRLPEGVVTVLEAAMPYITDPKQRGEVQAMLPHYRENQQKMQEVSEDVATRWVTFDTQLADSLATGRATEYIVQFIANLENQWNDDDKKLFVQHRSGAGFTMTRELAVRLEQAQESILCAQAALLVGNKQALRQIDRAAAFRIIADAERVHHLIRSGIDPLQIMALEAQAASFTASQNIETGGGCPGTISGNFRTSSKSNGPAGGASGSDSESASDKRQGSDASKGKEDKDGKKKEKKKSGKREVMKCVHCPLCSRDGVDAIIDYDCPKDKWKRITCNKCWDCVEYPY